MDHELGQAPVATDFDAGVVDAGGSLLATSFDIVGELGTDADSPLDVGDVTFTSATIDGVAASLADAGFSWLPDTGLSGGFSVDAGVPAYALIAPGDDVEVTISYTLSDGTSADDGVLSFFVAAPDDLATDVTFELVGPTPPGVDLSAEAIAAPGEAVWDVVASGDVTLEALLAAAVFGPTEVAELALDPAAPVTLAQAFASDEAQAEATASDDAVATAIADETASAVASASNDSFAIAAATQGSAATANASSGSEALADASIISSANSFASDTSSATSVSSDDSNADAVALTQSDALAEASAVSDSLAFAEGDAFARAASDGDSSASAAAADGSEAEADASGASAATASSETDSATTAFASGESAATAEAAAGSTADASAVDNSVADSDAFDDGAATATAENGSSSFAFAAERSDASAAARDTGVVNAIAIADATASANAVVISDALAFAANGSDATALAEDTSSASATANAAGATASAEALDGSTTTAAAQNQSEARAFGETFSVANAVASDGGLAEARATGDAASSALAETGATARATTSQFSASEAQAQASGEATTTAERDARATAAASDGVARATARDIGDGAADGIQQLIGAVTTDVTVAKAGMADAAMNAISAYIGDGDSSGIGPDFLSGLLGQFPVEIPNALTGAPGADALAKDGGEATAAAGDRSSATARADQDGLADATAVGQSEATADASSASDASALAQENAAAQALATDGATAGATANGGALANADASGASTALASSQGDAGSGQGGPQDRTTSADAVARDNSVSAANSAMSSQASADARDNAEARASATDASVADATASGGARVSLTADQEAVVTGRSNVAPGDVAQPGLSVTPDFDEAAPIAAASGADVVSAVFDGPFSLVAAGVGPGYAGQAPLALPTLFPAGQTVSEVVFSGLPAGSVLSAGAPDADGTVWTFAGPPPEDLTLQPPPGFSGGFDLTATIADTGGDVAITRRVAVEAVPIQPPAVTLSVDPAAGSEADQTAVVVVVTADAPVAGDQSVVLTVNAPADFDSVPVEITIADGATRGEASLTVADDDLVEGLEVATFAISNPTSGIVLGATTTADFTIEDNDVPPTPAVTLSVEPVEGSEVDQPAVVVVVTADAPVTGDQSVQVTVTGAGITPADFVSVPVEITIADGATRGEATLTVADDDLVEGLEVATFAISNPTSGIVLGATTTADFTIEDNDVPPAENLFALSLVDTKSDVALAELFDGAVIDGLAVAPRFRSITADFIGDGVAGDDDGSIVFRLFDDEGRLVQRQTENIAPFALFGDRRGDFRNAHPPLNDGDYTLEVTAFSKNRGRGKQLGSETLSFTLDLTPEGLTVALEPASISEDGGVSKGTVTRSGSVDGDLFVVLTSDDPSEASTPTSVLIPDGAQSASFEVAAVDDAIVDGPQTVRVTASAADFRSGSAKLTVLDDEPAFVLALVDTHSDTEVAELFDGAVIDGLAVAPRFRSITADFIGDGVAGDDDGSIVFRLFDDEGRLVQRQTENIAPFALFGDRRGDFRNAHPPLNDGDYTLEVTAFSKNRGRGKQLGSETLSFTLDLTPEKLTVALEPEAISEGGGGGDDAISALKGNDIITGASGNDSHFGGRGDHAVSGGSGDDFLIGNGGSELIRGGPSAHTVNGVGGPATFPYLANVLDAKDDVIDFRPFSGDTLRREGNYRSVGLGETEAKDVITVTGLVDGDTAPISDLLGSLLEPTGGQPFNLVHPHDFDTNSVNLSFLQNIGAIEFI